MKILGSARNKLYGTSILPAFIVFSITPYAFLQIIIDSLFDWGIILFISIILYHKIDSGFLKTNAIRIFLSGFLAKYVGVAYLALLGLPTDAFVFFNKIQHGYKYSIYQAVQGYTYFDNTSFLFILSGIIIAFISIFLVQLLFGLRRTVLRKGQKILISFIFAVLTSPYIFLIPSELIP